MAGMPLLAHILRTLRGTRLDMRVAVSCDSEELAEIARAEGAEVPFQRPAELAEDHVPIPAAIKHAMQYYASQDWRPDLIASVQPTCPLLKVESIDAALETLMRESAFESAVSVTEIRKHHPFRSYRLATDGELAPLTEYTTERYLQKQDRPPAFAMTGGFFIRRFDILDQWSGEGFGLGTRCFGQTVTEEEAIDIDTELDFLFAELVIRRRAGEASRPC